MSIAGNCHICGSATMALSLQREISTVTSDCKPWRDPLRLCRCDDCGQVQSVLDSRWVLSSRDIYSTYEPYFQSASRDQSVFTSSGIESRTAKFCRSALESAQLDYGSVVLDYGCGSGNVARCIRHIRSDLRIHGLDLSDRLWAEGDLASVVDEFHIAEIPDDRKFDLIVVSHSLEHVTNPAVLLLDLVKHLTAKGRLAIVVPNCVNDPLKLFVADHCTHFSPDGLTSLLARAGFICEDLGPGSSEREIQLLARIDSPMASQIPDSAWVLKSIQRVLEAAHQLAEVTSRTPQIGVFGTSIAGTWVLAEKPNHVVAFVDEDPGRVGRTFHARPVVDPARIPDSLDVVIPPMEFDSEKLVSRLRVKYPTVRWLSL